MWSRHWTVIATVPDIQIVGPDPIPSIQPPFCTGRLSSMGNWRLTSNHHQHLLAWTLWVPTLETTSYSAWVRVEKKRNRSKKSGQGGRTSYLALRFGPQVLINSACSPTSCAECRRLKHRCDNNVRPLQRQRCDRDGRYFCPFVVPTRTDS
jgi:hypothetical protein